MLPNHRSFPTPPSSEQMREYFFCPVVLSAALMPFNAKTFKNSPWRSHHPSCFNGAAPTLHFWGRPRLRAHDVIYCVKEIAPMLRVTESGCSIMNASSASIKMTGFFSELITWLSLLLDLLIPNHPPAAGVSYCWLWYFPCTGWCYLLLPYLDFLHLHLWAKLVHGRLFSCIHQLY